MGGGKTNFEHQTCEPIRIVPHPRTLRKARENVKSMVISGLSSLKIRNYLHRWLVWWTTTSTTWQYQELLQQFINVCWDEQATAYASALGSLQLNTLRTSSVDELGVTA